MSGITRNVTYFLFVAPGSQTLDCACSSWITSILIGSENGISRALQILSNENASFAELYGNFPGHLTSEQRLRSGCKLPVELTCEQNIAER